MMRTRSRQFATARARFAESSQKPPRAASESSRNDAMKIMNVAT